MKNLTIVIHHPSNDPDMCGDYDHVTVESEGQIIATYGDYYHDKGMEKALGFLDAVKYLCPEVTSTLEERADANPWL